MKKRLVVSLALLLLPLTASAAEVKALIFLNGTFYTDLYNPGSDNTKAIIGVDYTVLGNDIGTLDPNWPHVSNLELLVNPLLGLANMQADIRTAVRNDMINTYGMTFQLGDSVFVY